MRQLIIASTGLVMTPSSAPSTFVPAAAREYAPTSANTLLASSSGAVRPAALATPLTKQQRYNARINLQQARTKLAISQLTAPSPW
jgi:hypothetical protein